MALKKQDYKEGRVAANLGTHSIAIRPEKEEYGIPWNSNIT